MLSRAGVHILLPPEASLRLHRADVVGNMAAASTSSDENSPPPTLGEDSLFLNPPTAPPPPQQQQETKQLRALSLTSSKDDTASATGVKLSVRKLSFDSQQSRIQAAAKRQEEARSSSPGRSSSNEVGLPSLLKKLKQDAQKEIVRAAAISTQVQRCLGSDIRMLEDTLSGIETAHQRRVEELEAAHREQVDKLQSQIEQLTLARQQLEDEKQGVLDARDATVRAPSAHAYPHACEDTHAHTRTQTRSCARPPQQAAPRWPSNAPVPICTPSRPMACAHVRSFGGSCARRIDATPSSSRRTLR